jgi:hypothetical protein
MATPVLNNGLFLRDTNYVAGSHVDSYHLMNQLKDSKPDDMGVIDLWAMLQKVDMPLYSLANLSGKNVDPVMDMSGRWTWQIPIKNDLPFVVEDMDPSNTTKGLDGQTFQIKMSRREFGKGEIITYDKYAGVEMYIVPEADIVTMGDHVIYTVQLVNNDNVNYLDNAFLASGIKYFRVGSARGEYGQTFADMQVRSGFREYYNMLPTGEAHVHYTVSSRAKLMADGGLNADGTIPVTEIWKSSDPNLDPSVRTLSGMAEVMGKEYISKARTNGTLTASYLTRLDAKHMTKIGKDIETYLMWGKGGRIRQDGPDDVRMSVGLWKQLDSSYKYIFNKSSFSLELLRNALYNYYNGKVELQGPDPDRILECQIGIGMSQMINTLIGKEAAGLGWIVNADKSGLGAITGTGMNLSFGFAFIEIVIPYFARLRFKLNPAFDPIDNNTLENPMVDGFPLSSYSILIQDINDAANNVYLKKANWDPGFRWWYQNGTMDYFGKTSGFQSSDNRNGYSVYMGQMYPAIWVKDPSKLLKIVMRNPITGGSL